MDTNQSQQGIRTFPAYFTIETVKLCNSRCVFCTIAQWPTHTPFMPEPLFAKIRDELIENHAMVEQVCLNGCGEPLLDRQIARRVRELKNGEIKNVILTTNASLLDEEVSAELIDAGLDELLISFNGLDRDKYESLRVGLSFDTVMSNTLSFLDLRQKSKAKTRVRMRMEADPIYSEDEILSWQHFWREKLAPSDQVCVKRLHSWGNQLGGVLGHEAMERPCQVLWSTMNILSDGAVALCCIDFLPRCPVGSVQDSTIAEIWNGKDIAAIRSLHLSGKRSELLLCSGCNVWSDDRKLFEEER